MASPVNIATRLICRSGDTIRLREPRGHAALFHLPALACALAVWDAGNARAATDVFYYDLATGRSTFDTRINGLGSTVTTDKLTGLTGGTNTWSRADFTITAPSNRGVQQYFTGSSVADNDGFGIQMTAATLGANTPGTLSASGLSFTFANPVNAFAVELGDWATCCHPTALYISFDGGPAILVGNANSSVDNPGYNDGVTTFIGAIDDSGTFTTVTFWGEAAGGDVLYGGGVIRYALLPIGALSGLSVSNAVVALDNSPAVNAAAIIDATPGLSALFTGLGTQQQLSAAASQTLPLLTGGSIMALSGAMNGINRVVQARIDANRGLSSGDEFMGDRHVWLKPFGSRADQDDRRSVSGYQADTYGAVAGVDGTVSDTLRVGGAFAYARVAVDGNSATAPQSADIDMYRLIGYGSYALDERTEINFQADVGLSRNQGRRQIALTSTVASASYDSRSTHLGAGIGRTYTLNDRTSLIPSARLDYTWFRDESYAETGAGPLNLQVNARTSEALLVALDARLNHRIDDRITLMANIGAGYDLINERAAITSAFAGAPGASFVTYGIDPGPWIGRGGLGAIYTPRDDLEVTGRYDVEHQSGDLNLTASVKFNWAF